MANDEDLSRLIDDQYFLTLDSRFGQFNLFEAVGMTRAEIRHSNLLAFLLSPARPHGLGSNLLRRFLRAAIGAIPTNKRTVSALEVSVADLDGAVVYRERDHIDLLIEIREINLVVCVENKIDAGAGDGQLSRYRNIVQKRYVGWNQIYVFLTPDGVEPDDPEYIALSYAVISEIIESHINEDLGSISSEVLVTLRHYIEMLKREDIVSDQKLRQLALKVYERHKEAIDYIFDSLPTKEDLFPPVQKLIEARHARLVEDKHGATILRFAPIEWANIKALNSCPKDQWTRTGRNPLFQIQLSGRVLLSLYLGATEDDQLRQYIYQQASARPAVFTGLTKPIGKTWNALFRHELLSVEESEAMNDPEKIEKLRERWQHFVDHLLPTLTTEVRSIGESYPK